MPFDEFMALALYDPAHGYYGARIRDVGGDRADFATAATLTDALGSAIAAWVRSERDCFFGGDTVSLIEIGAGSGDLARSVLSTLGLRGRLGIRYRIVEVSEPLRDLQKRRLRWRGVSWHDSIEEALASSGHEGLLFSNELFDAFPAKWLKWDAAENTWREIWVTFDESSGLCEEFRPLPSCLDPTAFSALRRLSGPETPQGQRVEIQPSARDWIRRVSDHVRRGSLLSIDYGGAPEDIYARRKAGTLRGFYRHQRVEGGEVYRRFGQQDLTLDVNFTDLQEWGEESGWSTVRLESQAAFLERFGQGFDAMAGAGVGQAFRVLHQRREVPG